jgi:hypothetical protein
MLLLDGPTVIPGLDKALLQFFILACGVIGSAMLVTISSIAGLIRATRRRRRGGYSLAAVVLAALANALALVWLLYWLAYDLQARSNPINGLLAINLAICLLALSWLIASIRANRARPSALVSQ